MAWLTGYQHRKQLTIAAQGSVAGTIAVTNLLASVVGTGTHFTQWNVGSQIQLPDGNWYTILTITTDLALTISVNYPGPTLSGQPYTMRLVNYQVKITVQKKYANLYLNTPNAEPECMIYGVMGSILYWGSDFANTGVGHVYQTDLSTGITTTIKTGSQLASWQGLVAGGFVWTVGEEGTSPARAILQRITSGSVITVVNTSTGDCNELIAIETDGTNIIAGERIHWRKYHWFKLPKWRGNLEDSDSDL